MRNVLCWSLCAWLAGSVLAATPGYLTRLGPAPLRFQPVMAAALKIALPPLDISEPPSSAEPAAANAPVVAAAPATANLGTNKVGATKSSAPIRAPAAEPSAPAVVVLDSGSAQLATPDKFVRFFTPVDRGTNGSSYILPGVIFSPPVPGGSAPASQSTYSTPSN